MMVRLTDHAIVCHMVLLLDWLDTIWHMLFDVAAHIVHQELSKGCEGDSVIKEVARVEQFAARDLAEALVFFEVCIPDEKPLLELRAVTIKVVLQSKYQQVPDGRNPCVHRSLIQAVMEELKPDFPSRWVIVLDFVCLFASIGPLLRGEDHFEVAGLTHDSTGHCELVYTDGLPAVAATLGFFDHDDQVGFRSDVVALMLRRDLLGGRHLAVQSGARKRRCTCWVAGLWLKTRRWGRTAVVKASECEAPSDGMMELGTGQLGNSQNRKA